MGSFNFFSCTDVPSTPEFPLDLWFAVPYGKNAGDVVCGKRGGFCVLKTKTVKKKILTVFFLMLAKKYFLKEICRGSKPAV